MADLRELLNQVKSNAPLDQVITELLLYSKETEDQELEKWCQLELNGYFNTNKFLTEDVVVPEYRTISGQHSDIYGRPLVVNIPKFSMVNSYRLRQGTAELQDMLTGESMLMLRDPAIIKIIKDALKVEVHQFEFTAMSVRGVLNNIKTQLIEKIHSKLVSTPVEESEAVQNNFTTDLLHPLVKSVSEKLFQDGHYRQAILDTYIKLVEVVQTKSGRFDLDGTSLMQTVFSPKNPTIVVSEDADEQLGFMWLFSGAVMGIRNPKAHRLIQQTDPQRTLDWLHFASVLMKVLDDAKVIKNS